MPQLPLVGGSYNGRSVTFDNERTLNLFAEVAEVTGPKSPAVLHARPGLKRRWLLTESTGGLRAIHRDTRTDRVFAVHGTSLMELNADGTGTNRGTLTSGGGAVSIASNDSQMIIVDGQVNNGHIYDLAANTLTAITDDAFFGGDTVTYNGGYFVLNVPGTAQFYQSALLDGSSYNALDLATAEAEPDLLTAVLSDTRNLWLFGTESTEVWFHSGAPTGISFDRIDGAVLAAGTVGSHAATILGGVVAWLGQSTLGDAVVYRGDNFQLNRISTHPVELSMRNWGDLTHVRAYAYTQEGHNFFVWTHPNGTWMYDSTTNLWFEMASFDTHRTLGRHRVCCMTRGHGVLLGGDFEDGRVYEIDLDTYTDDTEEVVRLRRFPAVSDPSQRWIRHQSLELDVERGVGLTGLPTIGIGPDVSLRWSNDHGRTWSVGHKSAMGLIGEYETRVIWRRLGRARNRVYEISATDPVQTAWVAAELTVI